MTSNIFVRDEAAADKAQISLVHRMAFGGDKEGQLVDDLRDLGLPNISLVAERNGSVLGHILLSPIEAPMRALALGPLGVHPNYQRGGIGSALIREGIVRAQKDGWESVFLLGNPGYYTHFGFSLESAKGFSCPYTGDHFMALQLNPSLPVKKGKLVYPAPWAKL